MMARVSQPKLSSKTLALGLDKTFGQESVGHPNEEFESVTCLPEGIWTESWTCHVSNGGMFCEAAMCSFFFGVYVTRGAEGGETFMASRHPWDGYQAACHFERSAVGCLVVWGPEGFHFINRKFIPPRLYFLFISSSFW